MRFGSLLIVAGTVVILTTDPPVYFAGVVITIAGLAWFVAAESSEWKNPDDRVKNPGRFR